MKHGSGTTPAHTRLIADPRCGGDVRLQSLAAFLEAAAYHDPGSARLLPTGSGSVRPVRPLWTAQAPRASVIAVLALVGGLIFALARVASRMSILVAPSRATPGLLLADWASLKTPLDWLLELWMMSVGFCASRLRLHVSDRFYLREGSIECLFRLTRFSAESAPPASQAGSGTAGPPRRSKTTGVPL